MSARVREPVWVLALVLALVGGWGASCAGVTAQTVVADYGQSLKVPAELFKVTAAEMFRHCDKATFTGIFTKAQCRKWVEVEDGFKASFHLTVLGFYAAADIVTDGGVAHPDPATLALANQVLGFNALLPKDGG